MSPSSAVHAICGGGQVAGAVDLPPGERCWLCAGEASRGVPVDDWMGANFTGQNRARSPRSTHVCEACVYIAARSSYVPGRPPKEGKKEGGNFRNYSHLHERGWTSPPFGDDGTVCAGYVNASKGEKPLIRDFLRREHSGEWFAAIADSGQKHVIPWAPWNAPGMRGVVLFEELLVSLPDADGWRMVDDMASLLTAGATKDELESGALTARAWELCGDALADFEERHGPRRHSGWYSLALWLAQRDEAAVQERLAAEKAAKKEKKASGEGRTRKAAHADRGGDAGAAGGVPRKPRRERAEALGSAADAAPVSSPHEPDAGGVGDVNVPAPAAADAEQLGLFGSGGPSGPRPRARKRK